MIRNGLLSLRRHWKFFVLLATVLGFACLNALAYLHVYSLTHFVDGGQKTPKPEELSICQKAGLLFTGARVPRPANRPPPVETGLEFQVHRFPGVPGQEYESWYIPASASRLLCILFPGYTEPRSGLIPEARVLHELGYSTLLVDFRGCGGSSGQVTTIGYREAEDVVAAIQYARRALPTQPVVLFGRSMGAAAILRAIAHLAVTPDGIILECPYDRLLSTIENRVRTLGLPAFPVAHLLTFWGGVQHGYSAFQLNPAEFAERVDCPVLLMHGTLDPRVTRQQVREVFAGLPGKKRFVSFDQAGHEPYVRRFAAAWRDAVSRFLDELPSIRASGPESIPH